MPKSSKVTVNFDRSFAVLAPSSNQYAMLTPYLIPPELARAKAVNLGDGFIWRGIERLMGAFTPAAVFTTRQAPRSEDLRTMARNRGIILAGANQLNDHFAPWPGATPDNVRALQIPFIPIGVGLHGDYSRAVGLSDDAREILELMHDRIPYSSWRCPLTVAYLQREMPNRAAQFLMTGCPVAYDAPILDRARLDEGDGSIAVTVTDREDFWDRETGLLDSVAARFPAARRAMVLQQDFVALGTTREKDADGSRSPLDLRRYAARLGYEVIAPKSIDAAIATYADFQLHIGSRLHVHLLFISQNKRSLLVAVDDRAAGAAAAYGFPLSTASSIDRDLNFNFEMVRAKIRNAYEVMRRFMVSLPGAPHGVRV